VRQGRTTYDDEGGGEEEEGGGEKKEGGREEEDFFLKKMYSPHTRLVVIVYVRAPKPHLPHTKKSGKKNKKTHRTPHPKRGGGPKCRIPSQCRSKWL
jgi:hypothetical protein